MRMGWNIFNKRPWIFVGVTVLYIIIISALISGLSGALPVVSPTLVSTTPLV